MNGPGDVLYAFYPFDPPEGIVEMKDGTYMAYCCRCGELGELYVSLSEIPTIGYEHYCGRSPRCIP